MIKYNGQDIADIKYNGASIKRVMKDGVQIWPTVSDVINTPTGIQLSEYEILTIQWDYFITYTVTTNTEVRAYLKDDVILPFTGGDETQFELKVNGSPVVFTNFGIHYAPGASYVTLRNQTDFLPTDVIEFSYTAGADPIEGENTGTFAPDLVDQLVENTVEAPSYTYLLDDYPGAVAAYSLRKLRTGEVNAIEVRRDGASPATTNVLLYDDPSKFIDLLSTVEAGGTLGDWVGANSAYITIWYDQSGIGYNANQSTEISQPMIINAGSIERPTFDGIDDYLSVPSNAFSGDQYQLFTVHKSTDVTIQAIIFCGYNGACPLSYGRTSGVLSNFSTYGNLTSVSTPISSGEEYLSSILSCDGVDQNIYLNSVLGTGTSSGRRSANLAYIGSWEGLYFHNGEVSEIILYNSNQTSNRAAIEASINENYNIFPTTAEVDAQLIQADTDNVSDSVIEIKGIRSSASDTAVANLISRNVTVITK